MAKKKSKKKDNKKKDSKKKDLKKKNLKKKANRKKEVKKKDLKKKDSKKKKTNKKQKKAKATANASVQPKTQIQEFTDRSSNYNVKLALSKLRTLQSTEELNSFIKDEDRKTIIRAIPAAMNRLKE